MAKRNVTWFEVLSDYIKHLIRGSLISTVVFFVLYPWYNQIYDKLSSISFMTDARIFALGVSTVHMLMYWSMNSFFHFCDTYQYLQKYKIPRLRSQKVSDELLYKTLKVAIFSQIFMEPLGVIYILFPVFQLHGTVMRYSDEETPSFLSVMGIMVLSEVVMEWGFYFTHRLMHTPTLYGLFHKQHHEYKGSIGFAAEYAHPVESIVSNFYPTVAGCMHVGSHPLMFYNLWSKMCLHLFPNKVYLCWRLWETYEGHSGYSFYGTFLHKYFGLTFGDTALYHDFHHTRNKGNYSGFIQDWVFGTDTGYIEWLNDWERDNVKQSKHL